MPELPEVETIVRYLRPEIRGKRILDVWSNTPRLFRGGRFSKVKKEILGARIRGISRLGKNIIFHLSNGRDLLIHLMMTGKLLWSPKNIREPHIRFWMKLSGGDVLALHDIRKFGLIRLFSGSPTSRGKSDFQKINLGPDALSLSFEMFEGILGEHRGAVKNLLMNQKIISGIGNIYSDEILWYAGIKPTRRIDTWSEKKIRKLFLAMHKVLNLAIKKEGTTSRDYRKPDGSEGGYYEIRKVYQREGERCARDGATIQRVKIGQRSTYFCPRHQK